MLSLIKNSNKNLKSYFTEEELNNFKELILNTQQFYRQQRIKLLKEIDKLDLKK
jgi:hypothetical protein